jgi:hypothetical protein
MPRPFLALVLATTIAASRGLTEENPTIGPVRIEGTITKADTHVKFKLGPKDEELRAKPYDVKFRAGRRYTITMNDVDPSKNRGNFKFDPILIVQDATGKILAQDDNSGGKLNAKLVFTAPKDGIYRVYAAALSGTGSFILQISEHNTLRQGFPAKANHGDLTQCDSAWEIDWDITNPDNGVDGKRSRPSSVLAIRTAKFMFKDRHGQPRWFTVLNNLTLGEILVPYDHMRPVFLDVSEHLFNIIPAKKEYLGPNCVAAGEILGSIDARMRDRVLKEVHDDGLRWMNGDQKTRRGEKMLVWALFDGDNYRYIIEYGFSDDGVITCRLGATAHNFFDRQTDGSDIHLHVGCWHWDPELSEDGATAVGGAGQNRVLLLRRVPRTPTPNGRFRIDAAPFNPDEKGRASEGFADWRPEEFTMLRIESLARKNGSNNPRFTAYDLVPMRYGAVRNYPWKYAFANHDFWVTKRRGDQTKYSDVPLYAMGSNPLNRTPCTVWHNSASLHVPRAEDHDTEGVADRGVALTTWAGFMLRPVNLCDSTPLYESALKPSEK